MSRFPGDGAPVGKFKTFTNLSVSLLDEPTPAQRQPQLIAILPGQEDYARLIDIMAHVNLEIAEIERDGIYIDGVRRNVRFFLCADYKFLLTTCGLKSANSNNACLFCECHKASYGVGGARERFQLRAGQPGVVRNHLLPSIPLERTVIDVMHMYLRVSDKILLLIRREISDREVDAFVEELRQNISCRGKIYAKDGKVEFANLDCNDRQRIIAFLCSSDLLVRHLGKKRGTEVKLLLAKFAKTMAVFHTSSDPDEIRSNSMTFLKMFLLLFQSSNVTPYIHMMAHHGHQIASRVGCLNDFTQQHVEKLNHFATSTFFTCTNFKDGVRQTMLQHGRRLLQRVDNIVR